MRTSFNDKTATFLPPFLPIVTSVFLFKLKASAVHFDYINIAPSESHRMLRARFLSVKFVCFLWSFSRSSFPLVGTVCLHHIFNFFQLAIISDILSSPHFFSLKLLDLLLSRPCTVLQVIASLSFCSFPSPHTVLRPEVDICHFI